MEQRIQDLEIKLTFQESIIEELNNVIFDQQKEINLLLNRMTKVEKLLESASDSNLKSINDETPPPHY